MKFVARRNQFVPELSDKDFSGAVRRTVLATGADVALHALESREDHTPVRAPPFRRTR